MDHHQATKVLQQIRVGQSPYIGFVTPAVATVMAAATLTYRPFPVPKFGTECQDYAANFGLIDVLEGRPLEVRPGGRQGLSYTRLTRLQNHGDVETCNAVISNLFRHRLQEYDPRIVKGLAKVVGELHDNVASHANGVGFSAAQIYNQEAGSKVSFAVADAGRGLLSNVRLKQPHTNSHAEAIDWCLIAGNTTADITDEWVQSMPSDGSNPYPSHVPVRENEDNHAGLGLHTLVELVRISDGCTCIWSGNAKKEVYPNKMQTTAIDFAWSGVIIEVEIPLRPAAHRDIQNQRLQQLAERLGL